MPVSELERLARQQDVAPKTLKNAKARLSLQYQRDGFGPGSQMRCALPGTPPYCPTSRDMGQYGGKRPAPAAEPVAEQVSRPSPHTGPSHTGPSNKTGAGASVADGPDGLELAFREMVAKQAEAPEDVARIATREST
jgi:hypothetical protein